MVTGLEQIAARRRGLAYRFDNSSNFAQSPPMNSDRLPPKAAAKANIDLERRAQIGAERRARSRTAILVAAFHCFGKEGGHSTRIEDICEEAGLARGTFYNHFNDIDELRYELSEDLTREFDRAVHVVFERITDPVERCAIAIRYYLHTARLNRDWGWAMVNSGVKPQVFGRTVWANSMQSVQEVIDLGRFRLKNARLGRDILMGATSTAMITLARGLADDDYPEDIARHVLISFGLDHATADAMVSSPLPPLPEVAQAHIVIANLPRLDPSEPRR